MAGGVSIKVDTKELVELVRKVSEKLGKDAVLQMGVDIVQQSVKQNFIAGGRPTKWAPLKYRKGQPLRDKGMLANSISGQVSNGKGYVTTNVEYAGTHNYGAKKGEFGTKNTKVKAHSRTRNGASHKVRSHSRRQALPWGDIPQREFMTVQVPGDINTIEAKLKKKADEV